MLKVQKSLLIIYYPMMYKKVSKAYLLPGRTDIKAENRPNVEEIPVLNIDWKTVEKEQDEIGKQFKKVFQ